MIGLRAPGAEGGVEQAVGALAPRLVSRGCEVTVFCRPGYAPGPCPGVTLEEVGTVRRAGFEALVHTARCLPRALGFDIVHVHAVGNALLAPIPRLAGVPVVVTAHALDWQRARWGPLAKLALRAGGFAARTADAVIAVSDEVAAAFPGSVRIANGVEPLPEAPLALAGVDGLAPGYLLWVGRIVPEKRLDRLIDAHAAARIERPLVVVGPEPMPAYANRLRALIRSDVRFVGPRRGEAKAALFHHAAAVATASEVEGLPLVVLEAMACGRVVLASDIRAHREALGDTGVLVAPGGWEDALRRVGDPAWAGLGETARARSPRFDWEAAADRTLAIYRHVASRHEGRVAEPPRSTLL